MSNMSLQNSMTLRLCFFSAALRVEVDIMSHNVMMQCLAQGKSVQGWLQVPVPSEASR